MQYLIIKFNNNSFEKRINMWFEGAGCQIITIEALEEDKKRLKRRINIYRKIKKIMKDCCDKKIIVFDRPSIFLLTSIFTKNCYLWLWNTLTMSTEMKLAMRTNRVYSFDEHDINKYHLKKNTQFFKFDDVVSKKNVRTLYFVGADKGRYDLLNKLSNYCIDHDILFLFQMIPDKEKEYDNTDILSYDYIEYATVLNNVSCSACVLDICKIGQVGMTFRGMEAIAYDKKIVTNNDNYRNFPFYSPDKIYVINDYKFNGLKEFLNGAEIKYDETIKDYYSIENWVKRFK